MSYATIEGFKDKVKGVQRSSLFEVFVTLPTALASEIYSDQTELTNILRFTCKSASIPESTIGVIEVPFMGRKVKYFGDRQYNEWQTTLIVDENWSAYAAIYNWHWLMNSPNGNVAVSRSMNDYKGIARITAYHIDGTPSHTMTLSGFWPSSMQELSMDWDNTDQTADLQISWAMDYVTAGVAKGAVSYGTGEAQQGDAPVIKS